METTLVLYTVYGGNEPTFYMVTGDLRHLDGKVVNGDDLTANIIDEICAISEKACGTSRVPILGYTYFIQCGFVL